MTDQEDKRRLNVEHVSVRDCNTRQNERSFDCIDRKWYVCCQFPVHIAPSLHVKLNHNIVMNGIVK